MNPNWFCGVLLARPFYCCRVLTFYFNLDSTAIRGLLTKLSVPSRADQLHNTFLAGLGLIGLVVDKLVLGGLVLVGLDGLLLVS